MEFMFGVLGGFGIAGVVIAVLLVAGVVWGIGKSAGWGKSKGRELKEAQKRPYAYLDEQKATQESVKKVVSSYANDGALGPYAQDILETFKQAELRRKGIFSILEHEFEKGSLTWDKFAAPVEVALDGITSNAAQIANRMQAFDSSEYLRIKRISDAGGYAEDARELQRLSVMNATLDEMQSLQGDNDRLLLELERLQAELTKLTGSSTTTDQIAEEIQNLTNDTKYYS